MNENNQLLNNFSLLSDQTNEISELYFNEKINEIDIKIEDFNLSKEELKPLPIPELSSFTCTLSNTNKILNVKDSNEKSKNFDTLKIDEHQNDETTIIFRNSINKRACNCNNSLRYSQFIFNLPSYKEYFNKQNSDKLMNFNRFKNYLHLIKDQNSEIVKLDCEGKKIEFISNLKESQLSNKEKKSINFDTVIQDTICPTISNDYYLNLSSVFIPNLIHNCLAGKEILIMQTGSIESHNVLLGPTGLFPFTINWLFDALKQLNIKFVVRCTAAQFNSENFIDLFSKHKSSKTSFKSLNFLNEKSVLNQLNEVRCSNLKRSAQALQLAINNNSKLLNTELTKEVILLITYNIYQYEIKNSSETQSQTATLKHSKIHFLDYGTNIESNSLKNTINTILENNQTNSQNKSNENKIFNLFYELFSNHNCLVANIGSFKNNLSNNQALKNFCDITEALNKLNDIKKIGSLDEITDFLRLIKTNRELNLLSNENIFNNSCLNGNRCSVGNDFKVLLREKNKKPKSSVSRRSSKKIFINQNKIFNYESNSFPRRLGCKFNDKHDSESIKSAKKILLKRKNLQCETSIITKEQWIDGPNLINENLKSDTNDNVKNVSINSLSSNKISTDSNSNFISKSNANYVITSNGTLKTNSNSNFIVNSDNNFITNTNLKNDFKTCSNENFFKQKRVEDWIHQQISKNSNDTEKTESIIINKEINKNALVNCNENIINKYATANTSLTNLYNSIKKTKKDSLKKNESLIKFNYKTNFQNHFKLTNLSDSEWSKEDESESDEELKLIEENLKFFSTNSFKKNFEMISNDQNHKIDLQNENEKNFEELTEPPKQLKLEKFLQKLISVTNYNELNLNNDNISDTNFDTENKKPNFFNKSNTSSASSSGVHLSSSKENKDAYKNNINESIYYKKDLNCKKKTNSFSITSSGHGTFSEEESSRTSLLENKLKNKSLRKEFKEKIDCSKLNEAKNLDDKLKNENIYDLNIIQNKNYCSTQSFLRIKNCEVILNRNGKTHSAIQNKETKQIKSQKFLFCCGLF